jgi:hypothetical protein
LRRAQAWRWEPPRSDEPAPDDDAQRRWDEARAKAIAWAAAVAADPRAV